MAKGFVTLWGNTDEIDNLFRLVTLNATGEEKAHGPTVTRTQDVSHTMRAL